MSVIPVERLRNGPTSARINTNMPKGRLYTRGQNWPIGTSFAWNSHGCGWWLAPSSSPAPDILRLDVRESLSGLGACIGIKCCVSTNLFADHSGCTRYTNPYITTLLDYTIFIDIWKALADGLWSSSTVIDIYGVVSFGGAKAITLDAMPEWRQTNPKITTSLTLPTGPASGCPTAILTHLTIYDDGTMAWT